MEPTSLESVLNGTAAPSPAPETSTPAPAPEATGPQDEPQSTGEHTAAPPADKKQDVPPEKRAKGLEAGIAAERDKRQAAERQLRELEQRLQAMQTPAPAAAPQPAPQPSTANPKPVRADFASEDDWLDARDAWRDREKEHTAKQQEQERAAREFKQKTQDALVQAAQLPGFDMDAFARTPIPEAVADAVMDSDVAGKLIHHLVTHPDEARRIAALNPARQIKEIARIEDRLSQPAGDDEDDDAPQARRKFPETLTQARDVRGQFKKTGFDGPTPLNAILK
jgi:hypothetical protein